MATANGGRRWPMATANGGRRWPLTADCRRQKFAEDRRFPSLLYS
jgi:hypothetical protein